MDRTSRVLLPTQVTRHCFCWAGLSGGPDRGCQPGLGHTTESTVPQRLLSTQVRLGSQPLASKGGRQPLPSTIQ